MILCNFFLISYQSPIILSYYVLKKTLPTHNILTRFHEVLPQRDLGDYFGKVVKFWLWHFFVNWVLSQFSGSYRRDLEYCLGTVSLLLSIFRPKVDGWPSVFIFSTNFSIFQLVCKFNKVSPGLSCIISIIHLTISNFPDNQATSVTGRLAETKFIFLVWKW